MELHEEVRAFLEAQAFAVVCLDLDLGRGPEGVVVVKASADLISGVKGEARRVDTAWIVERTESGPVLCLLVRVGKGGVGELAGEAYFDPGDQEDLSVLRRLLAQDRLFVAFLDETLVPAWTAELPWDEVKRLGVEQALDRAEQLLEETEIYDPDRARRSFQADFSLDRLLSRAFPD